MSKHTIQNLISLIAFTACLTSPITAYAAAQGAKVGVNSAVKGDVTIESGEQAAKQAVIKDPVFLGDEIVSNKVGSLQVILEDQSVFTVGPDCNLVIDKFVYDPSKNNNDLSVKVKKGMFRFTSGQISKSNNKDINITSPVGSMGIRGTMAEGLIGADAINIARTHGAVDPAALLDLNGATLFVLRGPGSKNSSINKRGMIEVTSAGKTVTSKKAGQAIFVPHIDLPPVGPFDLTIQDIAQFDNKLRTEPTSNQNYAPFELDVTPKATGGLLNQPSKKILLPASIVAAITALIISLDDDDRDDSPMSL